MQQRARQRDLDRAKGLVILLVVFGHIVAREPPARNEWYVLAKIAVYLFHMPFFMYLSGYVTFLSGAARLAPSAWGDLVSNRAMRLLLPFLIFGITTAVGKMLLAPYLHVDNVPISVGSALLNLVWRTDQSAAHSVWYVAVLFIECLLTPVLMLVLKGRTLVLLLLATVLYMLPIPHVTYLDEVAEFYVFFVLGGVAADAGDRWLTWVDRYRAGSWLAFAAAVVGVTAAVAAGVIPADIPRPNLAMLVCGVLSAPALHSLVRQASLARSKSLLTLAYFTFAIYLMNTPCIGLAKAILLKAIPWDGPNFLIFAPILMAAGLFGPIIVKRQLFRGLPFLDRITQ